MSEQRALLIETADRVLSALDGRHFTADAKAIDAAGLTSVLIPESNGGFGGDWDDAFPIVRLAGRCATCPPLAEAVLATHIAHIAGVGSVDHPSIASSVDGTLNAGAFTGIFQQVPWGRHVACAIGFLNNRLLVVECDHARTIDAGENLAGEARDRLHFESAPTRTATVAGWDAEGLLHVMALFRAAQMAGALEAALSLALQHTRERKQFGRPLAAFQAIQQQLAVLAEEAAAADMATAAGFHAMNRTHAAFECAAAKLRANQAAAIGASIAHQVHGAMGFTQEYPLQKFTRRLWAWRSEFGNERHWATEIGTQVAERGADNFWSGLVDNYRSIALTE